MTAIVRACTFISTPILAGTLQESTKISSHVFLLGAPIGSSLSLAASLTRVAKESASIFRIMCPR
jgi:hypothetical protein